MRAEDDQIEQLTARISELEREVEKSQANSSKLSRRTEDFAAQTECWFWETDANNVFNYLSDNLETVSVGLFRTDFIAKSRLEVIAASESTEKAQHIDAILFQKPFQNFRYSVKRENSEDRHIISTGWPIKNAAGVFMGYRGTARDETADVIERRLQMERERGYRSTIEQQSEEFRAIVENLNQSVMWFDSQEGLRLCNSRVRSVHLFEDEQVAEIKCLDDYADLLAQRGDLGQGEAADLARRHSQFLRTELKLNRTARIHLHSQQRHLRARYAGLPDGGFVITHVDITDEVTTESALGDALKLVEEANHALEERVEERTRELRELQSKLLKDERDATMSKLIAKMSHELRNPLNALNTSLYVIRARTGDDPRLNKAFDRSDRTIKRCVRILSDLFDYAMTRELKTHSVDIGQWSQQHTEQLNLPDGVALEFTNLAHGIYCDIDDKVLAKAIWKILHNAIHAVTTDAPDLEDKRIYFTVNRRDDRIEFVIQDNGNGMTEEAAGRATEPLFSTRGFGVGLGIPFAEQSFLQHGGGLKLKTDEGRGTTITLWLPYSGVKDAEQAA